MRSLNKQQNGAALEDQARISQIRSDVDALQNDVSVLDSRVDIIDETLEEQKELIDTDKVVTEQAEISTVDANLINSIHGDITALSSETIVNTGKITTQSEDVTNLNATNAIVSDETVKDINVTGEATIEEASITKATIDGLNVNSISGVESLNVNGNVTSTGALKGSDIEVTGTIKGDNVKAGIGNISEVQAERVDSDIINVDQLFVSEQMNADNLMSKSIAHDAYSLSIPSPETETKYNVIKLPTPETGSYRTTMNDGDGNFLFSLTINNAYGNINFSYSRNDLYKSFSEVYIYGGEVYVQTWYGGTLYYHNDSLHELNAPVTYSEWPFDTTEATYHYSAVRKHGNVYTQYLAAINLEEGGGQSQIGGGVLSMENTDEWRAAKDQGTVEYDTNTDEVKELYLPDQSLNTDDNVVFESVTTPLADVTSLLVEGGGEGQYLREKTAGSALAWESPAIVSDGVMPESNKLITAEQITKWNGSSTVDVENPETGETESVTENNITKLGTVTEGTWNAGDVTTANVNATTKLVAGTAAETYTGNALEVKGNAEIAGDLTVKGSAIITHEEQVTTDENVIILRHDATTAIPSGSCSGIQINNFDGAGTALQIAVDSEGTFRIGTSIGTTGGDNEPFLTRAEGSDLTDYHLLMWDAVNNKAVDAGVGTSDLANPITFYKEIEDLGFTEVQTTSALSSQMLTNSVYVGSASLSISDSPLEIYGVESTLVITKDANDTVHALLISADKDYNNYEMYNADGTWIVSGSKLTGSGFIAEGNGTVASSTAFANKAGTVSIGESNGEHIEIDGNQIISKSNDSTLNTGNGLYIRGKVTIPDVLLIPTTASNVNGAIWWEA